MDYLLITLGIIFLLFGIAGAIIPVLPGPPMSYIGLLFLHFTGKYNFESNFLWLWAGITAAVYMADYVIPAWGTKTFGGSKRGVIGSIAGLILGLIFFPPFGIIIGPFVGAVAGELLAGKDSQAAIKSGFGSFIGFLAGTILKLIASGMMTWYFFDKLFE